MASDITQLHFVACYSKQVMLQSTGIPVIALEHWEASADFETKDRNKLIRFAIQDQKNGRMEIIKIWMQPS